MFTFSKIVSSAGNKIYSEVKTFLKRHADMIMDYNSITTSGNETLTLSENHLIYARTSCQDQFNPKLVFVLKYLDTVGISSDYLHLKLLNFTM